MNRRTTALLAGLSTTALILAGCSDSSTDEVVVETPPATTDTTTTETTIPVPAAGPTGVRLNDDDDAYTYDEIAVPAGSRIEVDEEEDNGRTTVRLRVSGLEANRDFGAHVHVRACGPAPSDSGPHYQNELDPAATPDSPSTDPAYANPQNEIWLDFTTDENGNADSSTTVDWEFRDDEANSVVIHAQHTMTEAGSAGQAGDRLACVDEDF